MSTETGTDAAARAGRARLLDLDPELGRDLAGGRLELARTELIAPVQALRPGPWRPPQPKTGEPGEIGLYVADGAMMRDAAVGKVSFAELIGPGDVLRLWEADGFAGHEVQRPNAEWRVLQPTRLAMLDRRVAAGIGRWPELAAVIVDRTVRRSRRLALQVAICHLRRVDERLHLFLWMVADRWGRVTPDGVVIRLPLTHRILAAFVGAHCPSVTVALKGLEARGMLSRGEEAWTLRGESPKDLAEMYGNVL